MLSKETLNVVRHLLVDSSVLCLGHPGMHMDAHVYLDARGCTFQCVDVVAHSGCEAIYDLNQPCDMGQWDVVLDHGTIEHCFNVSRALMNAANAVKPGGYIFHSPPLTMVNHGYYALSPCLFEEFYKHNGWDLLHMTVQAGDYSAPVDSSLACRSVVPLGATLYVIAQRKTDAPLTYPTLQGKYVQKGQ